MTRLALLAVAAAACTPNYPATRVKYDGKVAEALAALAKDCTPIGDDRGKPMAEARDFTCTSPTAELVIHLDTQRTLRSVHIRLLAPNTDEARGILEPTLKPILDDHHRSNVLSHLDDPAPTGMSPIPQLQLEDFLYQIASEDAGDGMRRYIVRIRID